MARTELIIAFKNEINKYLGLPYFKNAGKYKNHGSNAYVGKGDAKEIALATIELANKENIKLLDLSTKQIYNFQKKHHLGIDCSGLACHLLTYYGSLINKKVILNPRNTSADMLTSPPLSSRIDPELIESGDLVRQKNGAHVVIIIDKHKDTITYVDSSFANRGVKQGAIKYPDPEFFKDGVFRLNQLI